MFALFFIFGGITSLNDVIIPKLKDLFTLSYAQVMLVQTAFFAAYFLISIPAAAVVRRIGYMRTATLGLLTMMVGCLLFVPASSDGAVRVFLARSSCSPPASRSCRWSPTRSSRCSAPRPPHTAG